MLSSKFCSAPSSALPSTTLLAFLRGEEVLQIFNLRNPFHVIYMIRIEKRECGNKFQNYSQGQESRAWPYQPEILMWNSRKITKHPHFGWMLTVNSSTGSEPQQTQPQHTQPQQTHTLQQLLCFSHPGWRVGTTASTCSELPSSHHQEFLPSARKFP